MTGERAAGGAGDSASEPPHDRAAFSGMACVVVCYRPDVARLRDLCRRLLHSCPLVIVADNTEQPFLGAGDLPAGCRFIAMGGNTGIARAQNAGVAEARNWGASLIAFFDQDSTVEGELLARLARAITPGVPQVVAPLCIDDATGQALPSQRLDGRGRAVTVHIEEAREPYAVDIVISSGTLATREVFEAGCGFDEGLFIDFVDTDWCLRCRSKGIPIKVVPDALMRHRIGSRSVRVGLWTVMLHGPARCYYQVRNCFLMLGRPHVPRNFALQTAFSVLTNRAVMLLLLPGRWGYLKAYSTGIRDGLRRVSGPAPF